MPRILLCLLPSLLFGGWTEFRYGSFQVLSDDADKEARQTLNYLEQMRNAVGLTIGQPDLQPAWPVRVIVSKNRKAKISEDLRLARDAYVARIDTVHPALAASFAKLLLDAFPGQIPPALERGLVSVFSTLDVDGTRVSLGIPPPQKDRDWSRAHMLTVHPDYSGKVRVLLGNLAKGVEVDVAYRNAFERAPELIERELDKYIEAGNYATYPVSGKPINAQREFRARPVEASEAQLALADVLLAAVDNGAQAAFQALGKLSQASEGLGLIAAAKSETEAARDLLSEAQSARPLVERAKLEKDPRASLVLAAKANPRWAEPQKLLARAETQMAQKLVALRLAAQLEPRNAENWILLAQAEEANQQFKEAGRSWNAAERVSQEPEARELIRAARAASENRRVEQQIAAREEVRRKAEQDLNDLRNRALLEIRAAEAKANADKPLVDGKKLDYYRPDGDAQRVEGLLVRVDCLDKRALLQVRSGKKLTGILVADPSSIAISGGGELALGCGSQKAQRKVTVAYMERQDKKLGTIGDAVSIEFR